jgi:GNAT superfamily N-acetyltransferase
MIFRNAEIADIPEMHLLRMAVKENILPDPDLITARDYIEFLTIRGKGWVCEIEGQVAGFAVVDLQENNVWALFVHPASDGKGIGRRLHDEMLAWYFNQTEEILWLGTSPNTRAEKFYRRAGWIQTSIRPNGELRFEMSVDGWAKMVEAQ